MKIPAYLFPRTSRGTNTTNNPYLQNFIRSVSGKIIFLNEKKPTNKGIFNLVFYLHKIDYLFLNWIEDLPDKKFGFLQFLFFYLILIFKKPLGVKIVWTLHNKISHSPKNRITKKMLFFSLLKRSDIILTHAREGTELVEQLYPLSSKKVFYFPHPIIPLSDKKIVTPKKYDILIWGSIAPYKGIQDFLGFLTKEGQEARFRLLVVGKAVSDSFYKQLKKYENDHIIIRNEFVTKEELATLINESKIVLFTYSGESVLSSGALIDSIAHYACIVGPNVGAFKEMAEIGIISAFNDFDELLDILNDFDSDPCITRDERISDFIKNHTWEKFGMAFQQVL